MERASSRRSYNDVMSGLVFVGIAIGFAIEGSRYQFRSGVQMGPGFFPMILAGMLAVFGVCTIVAGFRKAEFAPRIPIAWRGAALVSVSLALFGAFGRSLGLVPAVFLLSTLTAMASTKNSLLSSVLIGAVISLFCFLVFDIGLNISLPTFGSVFGG